MPHSCIGVDIGSCYVKLVEVKSYRKTPRITRFTKALLPPKVVSQGKILDANRVGDLLKTLLKKHGFTSKRAVIGVTSSEITVKLTTFPTMSKRELSQAVEFELDELISFAYRDLDEISYSYDVIEKGSEEQKVVFTACRRSLLEPYLISVRQAGLEPEVVDIHGFSVPRITNYARSVCYVDIGAEKTWIYIENQGVFRVYRILNIGSYHLDSGIVEAFGVSPEEAVRLKETKDIDYLLMQGSGSKSTLRSVVQQFIGGILQTLDFLRAQERAANFSDILDRVVLAGGGSHLAGFPAMLVEELNVEVEVLNPFSILEGSITEEHPSDYGIYAPAVGLALRGLVK